MNDKDRKEYAEFMERMHRSDRYPPYNGYVDGLVAHLPAESEASREMTSMEVAERIKSIRQARGLSIEDVALRSGIKAETITRIESKEFQPPLGVLIKLGKVLKMKMGTLISTAGPKDYTIVRAAERKDFSRQDPEMLAKKGYAYQHLAFDKGDRHMEPFIITLDPTGGFEAPSTHDGEEFIFVLQGQMKAIVGEDQEVLNPGDAIYYSSSVPHLVAAEGDEPTVIVAVLYEGS